MRRAVVMVALSAVLTGACGGDGGESAGPGPSVTSPASTASSTVTTATSVLPSTTSATPVGSTTTTLGSGPTSTTRPGGPALNAASTVNLRGIGPVRVEMTLAEASAAAGTPIVVSGGGPDCSYAAAQGGPAGVRFMVVNGRIARVDVTKGPVKTLSGAGVGDTEAQVQARYAGKLQSSAHKYVQGGHYLTLVPSDAADANLRLIFETDGTTVTQFRAGRQPEVSYIEGCF